MGASYNSSHFCSTGITAPALQASLDREASNYMHRAYAAKTQATYSTHRRSYLSFCAYLGINPIPANTRNLCQYAAVLARSLKYTSIKQYMNIVRIIHQEWSLPNPLENNYHLHCVLRGIRRSLGDTVSRKRPMEPSNLLRFLSKLDLSLIEDAAMWATMLLLFFGILRVASVLCPSSRCDHRRHVVNSDISRSAGGLDVLVRHTKTIQFNERSFSIPLPRSHGNPLCPVQAIACYRRMAPRPISNDQPAFMLAENRPLTAPMFTGRIKTLLAEINLDPGIYAGHSFRRGGATLAYRLDVPVDTIRQLGDWASNSYTAYMFSDRPLVSKCITRMVNGARAVPY